MKKEEDVMIFKLLKAEWRVKQQSASWTAYTLQKKKKKMDNQEAVFH